MSAQSRKTGVNVEKGKQGFQETEKSKADTPADLDVSAVGDEGSFERPGSYLTDEAMDEMDAAMRESADSASMDAEREWAERKIDDEDQSLSLTDKPMPRGYRAEKDAAILVLQHRLPTVRALSFRNTVHGFEVLSMTQAWNVGGKTVAKTYEGKDVGQPINDVLGSVLKDNLSDDSRDALEVERYNFDLDATQRDEMHRVEIEATVDRVMNDDLEESGEAYDVFQQGECADLPYDELNYRYLATLKAARAKANGDQTEGRYSA